jgi:hypothetical protein
LRGAYNVIQNFTSVVIDYNDDDDYIARMKLTEKTIFVTGIGRRRAEAFHALGNKVIIAGRREEVRDQTTDGDPGMASVTLDERRSACVSL